MNRQDAVSQGVKQHTYMQFVNLLSEADIKESDVFRWWILQMLLGIHGDLDSIAFTLRKLLDANHAASAARLAEMQKTIDQLKRELAARPALTPSEVPPARMSTMAPARRRGNGSNGRKGGR